LAATVWKGYIAFGLISVPVRLHSAARPVHISFHQLHAPDLTRVKQQLYCPNDNRVVDKSEIVKGYQIAKDEWVVVEPDEIKKVAPKSSEVMEILDVVKMQDVDPLYLESSYYAVPEAAGAKAYYLLVQTMEKTGLAAIAKLAMHNREYTVLLRPRENGLVLHTLYYQNEVRKVQVEEDLSHVKATERELELAEQLLRSLEAPFQPEKYHDEYQRRLQELIDAKSHGKRVRPTPAPKVAPVIDIMTALEQSLRKIPEKKPAAKAQSAEKKPRRKAG